MNHAVARFLKICLLIPALVAGLGCAHSMEVTNLADYELTETEGSRLDIDVRRFEGRDSDGALYHDHIVQGLKRHPSVRNVRVVEEGGGYSSSKVTISPNVEYSGSGLNFLIDFPGFLVFANAWNGFVYHADIDAAVTVEKRSGTESMQIPVSYSMRHCDFGRGFWTGTGWWFPGWGLTNAIVGLAHIPYDDDATASLHPVIAKPYGDYMAERIVRSILGVPSEETAVGADETQLPVGQNGPR